MKATTRKERTAAQQPSEIIVTPLTPAMSKEQACAMFAQEAILIGSSNVIPLYRVCELLGGWVRPWFDVTRTPYKTAISPTETAYMRPGVEWNAVGDVGHTIYVLYERGFLKVVSASNAEIINQREKGSAYALED